MLLLLTACLAASEVEASAPEIETAGLSHLMRGLHFMSRGHASAAVPHLRLALLYDPASPFIHVELSEAWLQAGDREKAKAIVHAGLEQSPRDPELNLRAGIFAVAEERYGDALRPLSLAARGRETGSRAAPPLVDALLWERRWAAAQDAASRAAQLSPSDVSLLHSLGAAFEDHGRLGPARSYYSRARAQRPSSRIAALSEMRAFDLQGRSVEAAEALVALFAHFPNEPQLYMLVYRHLKEAGRKDADAYLREAQRLAGRDYLAAMSVARGLAVEGEIARGIEYLEELDIARPEVSIYLAELEQRRGEPDACVRRLRAVEDPRGLRRVARCEAQLGHPARAMAAVSRMLVSGASLDLVAGEAAWVATWSSDLGTAREQFRRFVRRAAGAFGPRELELAEAQISDHFGVGRDALARLEELDRAYPNDVEIDLRLADAHCRFGEPERGLRIFESLVERAPANAARANALGFTLVDLGRDVDRAEVLIRRAYRASFDEGYITDSLGWLHFRRGELGPAKRFIERAIRLDGPEAVVLLHLGDVQRALGDERAARQRYREALRNNPTADTRVELERRLKLKKDGRDGVRASERATR